MNHLYNPRILPYPRNKHEQKESGRRRCYTLARRWSGGRTLLVLYSADITRASDNHKNPNDRAGEGNVSVFG